MKVLFAVNNDNISDAIIKKYQKEYKEIISYKNVYYFNAILKELQNDKTYDRVVISEDLEPFANNNYDTIDKFLFEKLDKISDEATKANGDNIEIILICTDRRNKSDDMLTKIFGIGIYNAIIGDERNIDNLCKLMYQPRTKKEAKISYKIDGANINYQVEDENNVSESEVQNILAHYKRLGKNEDKYVDSFNNIVSQYTDAQLKIIIRYLPMNVKAVLEERSPKYQQLATFSRNTRTSEYGKYDSKRPGKNQDEEKIKIKMLKNEKDNITKPIVIPSALKSAKTVKTNMDYKVSNNENEEKDSGKVNSKQDIKSNEETKKGRGRPKKNTVLPEPEDKPKRGRGRPKKNVETKNNEDDAELDLFNLDFEEDMINNTKKEDDSIDLFNMGNEDEINDLNNLDDSEFDLFSLDNEDKKEEKNEVEEEPEEEKTSEESIDLFNMEDIEDSVEESEADDSRENKIIEQEYRQTSNFNTLLTGNKKVVLFVGTTKNGTSFIVNNLAVLLSSMNVSTAILDTTQTKNAYYIYTKNEESLRTLAENSISNLEKGFARGVEVNKNLTVYTELPGENQEHNSIDNILTTLLENHDVVLIDADFNTDLEYFNKAQEIYLVQSMDILTIQPLTAFLRNLKSKNILRQEKIRIVINKEQKVKSLSDKVLIGGMSLYNDPAMAFMTELFNKNEVKYCKIPFEVQNYVKYLESLVNCEISLRGYTKQFLLALDELATMVYPLISQVKYSPMGGSKKKKMQFSDKTNSTLDKMKRNY